MFLRGFPTKPTGLESATVIFFKLTSQVQWHFERRYQQILTLTYDFSPALSLGSRLIWQVEGINTYFTLRRSGYAGTDFFIILGDPNAQEFKQRLVAKVIRAF